MLTKVINLVTKYCCKKMVSSAKLKADMKVILGQSHQFIQMAPQWFKAEQSLKD